MNIYLIEQEENSGWDTFSSAVVIAESEDEARLIHPGQDNPEFEGTKDIRCELWGWTSPEHVKVSLLGRLEIPALGRKVLCASYHAG